MADLRFAPVADGKSRDRHAVTEPVRVWVEVYSIHRIYTLNYTLYVVWSTYVYIQTSRVYGFDLRPL